MIRPPWALVVVPSSGFLLAIAAFFSPAPVIAKNTTLSEHALDLTVALSDAPYAIGTMLAVRFAVHLPARSMLLMHMSAHVVPAASAAWSQTAAR